MGTSILKISAVVAMLALAGCSGGLPGGNGGSGQAGQMTFYVSDQPGSIDDFSHLNVTVTKVGVHRVNGTGNQSGQWITRDVPNVTVDLTQLQGKKAASLTNTSLPNGTYNNVFVYVSNVRGTLTDGSHPDVKLPSSKLHVAENFTVGSGEKSHFVFDLMVHGTGNGKYIVRPNAGESGKGKAVEPVHGGASGKQNKTQQQNRTKKQNRTHKTTQSSMALYLSDRPAAIGDFSHLNVTVTQVGIHRVGGSGNQSGQWLTESVDNLTVDLTKLQGEKAVNLANVSGLPNGTYNNVFVYVSNVNGTLTDGSHPNVKLPSSKLHINQAFTVGGNESSHFVFDVAVHKTGNGRYIVEPNVADSGKGKPMKEVSKKQAQSDSGTETEQTSGETTTTTTTTSNGGNQSGTTSGNQTATTSGNQSTTSSA